LGPGGMMATSHWNRSSAVSVSVAKGSEKVLAVKVPVATASQPLASTVAVALVTVVPQPGLRVKFVVLLTVVM
jgi:hypothetical protein